MPSTASERTLVADLFPGNCWSRNASSLSTEISAAHALLAKAERLLWEGVRPAAATAILAPRSATLWDDLCTLFDNTCIFGKRGNRTRENRGAFGRCCFIPSNIMDSTNSDQAIRTVDYLAEVYGDYHALAQVHHEPVTWIDETALLSNTNKSALDALSSLVLTEPNIPAATVEPVLDWVNAGGHLVVICAAGVLDEYNTPNPKLWQGLGLIEGGGGSTLPEDYANWAPASRMNVHVAGELILAANGTGSADYAGLDVTAYGRRCMPGLPNDTGSIRHTTKVEAEVKDVTVLATFSDGATAVSLKHLGQGSVIYFAWLPGVSHLAAMQPSARLAVPRAPDLISDASKWLAAAVGMRRRAAPARAAAAADVALVETPLLLSATGAVVTVLDWRPRGATWKAPLILNVTLPFAPTAVESALHGELHWVPAVVTAPPDIEAAGWYRGTVKVTAPPETHGADYISFAVGPHLPRRAAGDAAARL